MRRTTSKPQASGELALIQRIRDSARTRNNAVRLGIGDDCAVLRLRPSEEMLVTTDFCLEGRHFRRDWHSAESAGHRCLTRGLSDVAAMGGRPIAAFLSLALPSDFDPDWLDGFLRGFQGLAQQYGVELAGGDTAQSPGAEILADVMVVGAVRRGCALLRGGARPGDGLYVTGTLGGSVVELEAMRLGARRPERGPQSFPQARVDVGRNLVGIASACMDLSDGLSSDLQHLCKASGVAAELDAAAIPLGAGATLEQALHGGEDYELLFSAAGRVPRRSAGVAITRIGSIVAGEGVRLDGAELRAGGWEHLTPRVQGSMAL